ncbi:MAG: IS66 family transposase [bacterium]
MDMEESFEIPDLDEIQDLGSAKFLLKLLLKSSEQQAQTIAKLSATIEQLRHELAEVSRALFGQKSERVVPIDREIARRKRDSETPEQAAERQAKAKATRDSKREKRRDETPTEVVEHRVEEVQCPQCGVSLNEADVLADEVSEEYEFVPARVIRREHHRQRLVCKCGCFTKGDLPARVVEGGLYGPGLHAHIVVAKCADSTPLDRQARGFKRAGVPLSKSTLCDLFHRTAEHLSPISEEILRQVAASSHINADETSMKIQTKGECRRGFLWDFIAKNDAGQTMVAYRFSPNRSGHTPIEVLGDSTGVLQVDGYTGYNKVTTPEKRDRAGCWAHARRKFFAALETSPQDAEHAIDLIRQIYEVEYEAAEKDFLGTDKHRALRSTKSRKIVDTFMMWAKEQKDLQRPKSPLGVALTYVVNQQKTLELFLNDPKIRLDNNIAEQHLRLIALGRKNFLFVGHDEAGRNLATLQTLVSTCLANDINPQTYLTDVLLRIQDQPQSRIAELLPWNWAVEPRSQ